MPKYHKLQRAICLALFLSSSILSFFQYHTNSVKIAALSLIGVIAYDIVCYFKGQLAIKDHSADIANMKEQHAATYQIIKEMKDDVSVAKLANTFRR